MPPAILADSDEDEDDIIAYDCDDEVSSSRASKPVNASGEGAVGGYDGSNDISTGSTERLRRQIQSAERGLISNSVPDAHAGAQQQSSGSPSMAATKRRHTAAFASEGNASPEKAVKRTKTWKTYGASKRQIEVPGDSNFNEFRNEEAGASATSQSVRFSDHSAHQSSMPLPTGSLQTDFINHEPAVMFKDTGDTVADASSEQMRLIVQALGRETNSNAPMVNNVDQASEPHSSSIPWTASEVANSARSKKGDGTPDGADSDKAPNSSRRRSKVEHEPAKTNAVTEEQEHAAFVVSQSHANGLAVNRPKSSPIVEIQLGLEETAEKPAAATQKSAKRKSRKIEQPQSEPLNSDDLAVGLPREKYVPRPSRRRATQVVEDPIDFSIRPERAAKVKRTKTTEATTSAPKEGHENVPFAKPEEVSQASESATSKARPPRDRSPKAAPSTTGQPDSSMKVLMHDQPSAEDQEDKQLDGDEAPAPTSTPTMKSRSSPNKNDKSAPPTKRGDDEIFVKPAIPTPKPKSSSKSKRAKTTIFEDHVEFLGSQRSPNLSQQQAARQSALKEVKNEPETKPARKRKNVIAEDSDDEDELAKENDEALLEQDSPPKKRGRGRPSKAKAKPQAEPEMEPPDDGDEEEAETPDPDEPPKERGRGRPSKLAGDKAKESKAEARKDTAKPEPLSKDDLDKLPDEEAKQTEPDPQPASTTSKPSATEMPTPSPERQPPKEQPKTTPQKPSATAQHSPIKKMATMHRVGLNKKQRLPSLLRSIKPVVKK